jgi:hypothetical protein
MSQHGAGRRKPYTSIGISRIACVRCSEPSRTQFQICADNRLYRPFCTQCDIELNEMVMRWIWGDAREDDLKRYREEMEA